MISEQEIVRKILHLHTKKHNLSKNSKEYENEICLLDLQIETLIKLFED